MFLRSVTLRGFKSFADKTQLVFEPGITVIVGPNGSGKSNVVDALTWVLGTHSAKSLRGGSMADVVFAGSPRRPALGRASVEITIDNSPQDGPSPRDGPGGGGILPLEFSEVTLLRAMFASGESEYAINGETCRALDVQELLSDTGLGRETHTIVGQGRLDAVLNARPEDRRAFVEEAAGILKHRRRKDRAVRKLAQMEAHLERLSDVLRELRRNLRPLERQAEAAARHAALQAELRAVRIRRALRELHELDRRRQQATASRRGSDDRLGRLEAAVAAARTAEARLERSLAELGPAAATAAETHFALANLVERYRGLAGRIAERRRGLEESVEEPIVGRDPAELRARAAAAREEGASLQARLAEARAELAVAEDARRAAEQARRAHEQAAAREARRRAEARERLLRWEGQVSALRSTLAQAAGEEGRLAAQLTGARARRQELVGDRDAVQAEIQRLDTDTSALAARLAAAEQMLERRQLALDAAARRERELERRRASLEARADALRAVSSEAGEGSAALLEAAASGTVTGVTGPLADLVRVEAGMARALSAALGPLGDAVVVESPPRALDAIGLVTGGRHGRVVLLVADEPAATRPAADLSDLGARLLVDVLDADTRVMAALHQALWGVYVAADLTAAADLAGRFPGLAFVTPAGETAGPRGWSGGTAVAASAVLSRAAAEQAERELAGVADELLRASRQVGDADRALAAARHELDAATAAMQESDGMLTAAAERLHRLGNELAACERELTLLTSQESELARGVAANRERLAVLERRGAEPVTDEPTGPDLEAERLDDRLTRAREREVAARLATSVAAQRSDELRRRADALDAEADEAQRQLAERDDRRRWRLVALGRCAALGELAATALSRGLGSVAAAAAERDRLQEEQGQRQRELGAVRGELRRLGDELAALREDRHRDDLVRRELAHALEAVTSRLRDELGVADAPAALHAAREGGESPADIDDTELAEAEERLVRTVALLGTVNPLALEEFRALQERHDFLTGQIADLRASKAHLLQVVAAVDERIRELFAAAFADVAGQFERIFAQLFPGGEGRLLLTDPDELLHSGVEVEARPPGKRVKRLSLLSGGERSLTALAVLLAIFAARPSPFYVLDEVDAALDDVNLQRLLGVLTGFRSSSQLLVITHQQRTMAIADCLYGVTMGSDGVSRVVSQRLRQDAPALR